MSDELSVKGREENSVEGIVEFEFIDTPENLRRFREFGEELRREYEKLYEARKKAERKADKKYCDFVLTY